MTDERTAELLDAMRPLSKASGICKAVANVIGGQPSPHTPQGQLFLLGMGRHDLSPEDLMTAAESLQTLAYVLGYVCSNLDAAGATGLADELIQFLRSEKPKKEPEPQDPRLSEGERQL